MTYLAEHQVHFGRYWSHFTHVIRPEQFCNVWRGWSKLKIITSLRQILANLKLDAHIFSMTYVI